MGAVCALRACVLLNCHFNRYAANWLYQIYCSIDADGVCSFKLVLCMYSNISIAGNPLYL